MYGVFWFQISYLVGLKISVFFFKMGQPRSLFVYFRSFQTQILQKKTVGVSRIRTRIVRVEGEHADHLTTTTTHFLLCFSLYCEKDYNKQKGWGWPTFLKVNHFSHFAKRIKQLLLFGICILVCAQKVNNIAFKESTTRWVTWMKKQIMTKATTYVPTMTGVQKPIFVNRT